MSEQTRKLKVILPDKMKHKKEFLEYVGLHEPKGGIYSSEDWETVRKKVREQMDKKAEGFKHHDQERQKKPA